MKTGKETKNGNQNLRQKNLHRPCLPLQEKYTEDWMPKHLIKTR
jgi:hypothetical protein